MDSLPPRCFKILLLIIITGILRCLEASAENANEARLQRLADDGDKNAGRVLSLLEKPGRLYNSVKVIMVLAEISAVYLGTLTLSPIFSDKAASAAAVIGILAVFFLVFGVYMPKRIAALHPESIILKTSALTEALYYIGMPLSFVLKLISDVFLLLFGIKPGDTAEEVTEEEIRMMVDIGSENGTIDPDEKEMIHNIFELDDTQIGDIMTHRTDTVMLWLDEADKWEEIISESNHSVYPVCDDSIDNITGILKSKDFYKALLNHGDVTSILRTPYFVPETIKADELFRQMQKSKTHFAVVLDEYGGLGGIITMSDLLEEIVGTLSDEYDESEEDDIVQLDSNTWKIAGSCDIDLVSETLAVELPVEEYNTFAGMILAELGEIPEDGATPELEAYGLQIRVTKIMEHRIEYALVTKIEIGQEDK